MGWVVLVYVLSSVGVAASAMFRVGLWTGASAFLASSLALIGTGGVKAAFLWYEKSLRLPRLAFGLVLIGIAVWLSRFFSVGLFGYPVTGLEWTALGIVVGVICIDRALAV